MACSNKRRKPDVALGAVIICRTDGRDVVVLLVLVVVVVVVGGAMMVAEVEGGISNSGGFDMMIRSRRAMGDELCRALFRSVTAVV